MSEDAALARMAMEVDDLRTQNAQLKAQNRKLKKRVTRLQHRIHNAAEVLDGGWPTDQQLETATALPDSEP